MPAASDPAAHTACRAFHGGTGTHVTLPEASISPSQTRRYSVPCPPKPGDGVGAHALLLRPRAPTLSVLCRGMFAAAVARPRRASAWPSSSPQAPRAGLCLQAGLGSWGKVTCAAQRGRGRRRLVGTPEAKPSPVPVPPWCREGQDVWVAHICVHTLGGPSPGSSAAESPPRSHTGLLARSPGGAAQSPPAGPLSPGLSASPVKAAGVSLEHFLLRGPVRALEMKTHPCPQEAFTPVWGRSTLPGTQGQGRGGGPRRQYGPPGSRERMPTGGGTWCLGCPSP